MTLRSSPAGYREITVGLQRTGSLETPFWLFIQSDGGPDEKFNLDEVSFIGAAVLKLADSVKRGEVV